MVHGNSRIQRVLIWRMLCCKPNKIPLYYPMLVPYIRSLTLTYLQITRNFLYFWAQHTRPIENYKMESFSDWMLLKYARWKNQLVDITINDHFFEEWIAECSLMQKLHTAVFKCLYSPFYELLKHQGSGKNTSYVPLLDPMDVVWLNSRLDNELEQTWSLIYSSNFVEHSLRVLADSIVNKGMSLH